MPNRHPRLTLVIGLTILLAATGPGLADDPLFPGAQYLTAGSGWGYSGDGIVGDLNGDGHLDVVAAQWESTTISVMLNDGAGRLALAGVHYASGPFNYGIPIVASDLDNDGDLDLAFQDTTNPATISVLLGNGDGTFSPGSSAAVGVEPLDIAAGDLDGDGDADLVTVDYWNHDLSVLLNNGDATFADADSIYVQYPSCLVIAELTGDDALDLAVGQEDAIGLLPGNGDGTFGAATSLELPGSIFWGDITATDVDDDEDQDLIAAVPSPSPDVIVVLRNYGNGTFAPYESYPVGGGAEALATGDLNGDGNPDVVAKGRGETAVLLGLGNGAFAPAEAYHDLSSVENVVALGDLDGDGALDVINPGPLVTVLLGNGDGTLVSGSAYGGGGDDVVSADLDGDGDVDLATDGVYVLLNEGDGVYSEPVSYPGSGQDITAADLDGDGDLDLATARPGGSGNYYAGSVAILLNHGDGTFELVQTIRSGHYSYAVAAGDLNGDSYPELAVANRLGDDVSILINNGDGTFARWASFAAGDGASDVVLADLDGDGNRDLVVGNRESDGDSDIYILIGNGDGTFAWPPTTVSAGYAPVAVADLDHDGNLDLAAGNDTGDGLAVLLGNGDGTFGAPSDFWTGLWAGDLAIGDVDGDGHPDLVSGQQIGPMQHFMVLLGQGDGTFGAPLYFAGGCAGVTVDDLDGDGALDLASSRVAVLLNQSLTIPGDLDGDGCVGHSDLAILLADWGCGGGDCPGDVDGDGDTDHSDLAILLAHWGEGCP